MFPTFSHVPSLTWCLDLFSAPHIQCHRPVYPLKAGTLFPAPKISRVLLPSEFLLYYQSFVPPSSGVYGSVLHHQGRPPSRATTPMKTSIATQSFWAPLPQHRRAKPVLFSEWGTTTSLWPGGQLISLSLIFPSCMVTASGYPPYLSSFPFGPEPPLLWTTAPLIPKTFLQSPWELLSIAPNFRSFRFNLSQTAPTFLWFSLCRPGALHLLPYTKKIYSCSFYPIELKTWMQNWGLNSRQSSPSNLLIWKILHN